MGVALKLYEQLTDAGEDKGRARLIAEAFERLEERYPELKEVATQGHVRESELRLQKEIKEVEGRLRLEIKEVEGKLRLEIEGVRLEIKEVEGRLQKEIEGVRLEIKMLDVKMAAALHRQTLWVVGSVGAIVGLIRLMDYFLHSGVAH
jgi:hypothetical protein